MHTAHVCCNSSLNPFMVCKYSSSTSKWSILDQKSVNVISVQGYTCAEGVPFYCTSPTFPAISDCTFMNQNM